MSDAQSSQVEDKGRALNAFDEFGVLMDWHVVNESILETHADRVPAGAKIFQPAQDQRLSEDDVDRVVVVHLLADGHHVAANVRIRIPSRSQRFGDDARAFAGGDEKKTVAEVL